MKLKSEYVQWGHVPDKLQRWIDLGGPELEKSQKVLEGCIESPVRLVDAQYLIRVAREADRFERRQDLPEEAFISVETLISDGVFDGIQATDVLPIFVVSHPWLLPTHPDPKGRTLRMVALALESFLAHAQSKGSGSAAGVFLDFMSCHQKGLGGEERSPEHKRLFGVALDGLHTWYSHPNTFVLQITTLPDGYPDGYDFPPAFTANTADYAGRGWCFFESSAAGLVKNPELVIDIGKYEKGWRQAIEDGDSDEGVVHDWEDVLSIGVSKRPPPLHPDAFEAALQLKSFVSKKADVPYVSKLYKSTFSDRMGVRKELSYYNLDWSDDEAVALGRLLMSGALAKLEHLSLEGNPEIGDAGIVAIANSCEQGKLPNFRELNLMVGRTLDEEMDDETIDALVDAITSGGVPHLGVLAINCDSVCGSKFGGSILTGVNESLDRLDTECAERGIKLQLNPDAAKDDLSD